MQKAIQFPGAQRALLGRGDDLDIPQRIVSIAFWQAAADKIHHQPLLGKGIRLLQEEEIPSTAAKVRHLAPHNSVSVGNDQTFRRLAEYPLQMNTGHQPALDEIPQNIAGGNGRQLVAVPHHNKPGAQPHPAQQVLHQQGIHHRHFIHDDRIGGQGVLFPALKGQHLGFWLHLQQPVDGTGLPPGDLRHALGGTAGGSRQRHLFAPLLQQRQDAPQSGGLAGAGAAGQDKQTALHRFGNGAALHRVVGNALCLLQLVQLVLHWLQPGRL